MLKPLKLKTPADRIFAIGDTHFGHDRPFILRPRGFTTIEEHDETLIARWNETVGTDGVVIHLGDFAARKDEAGFWAVVRRLHFSTMYLLAANHTSGQRQAYVQALKRRGLGLVGKGDELLGELYPLHVAVDGDPGRVVVFLPTYAEMQTPGDTRLILCHFPIISHHKMAKGSIHLCGHSHGNLALTHPKTGRGKRLDVGVESFGRPISLAEIRRIMAGREVDAHDHHGRDAGEESSD